MANEEQVAILKQGVEAWNAWRKGNPDVQVDLSEVELILADLAGVDLREVNLRKANLSGVSLRSADLRGAVMVGANLHGAYMDEAHLEYAELNQADLTGAYLGAATLRETDLTGANLGGAALIFTTFANIDLSTVHGLDTIEHQGPSHISLDTWIQSKAKISKIFLRGCGVPDSVIDYLPSLLGAMDPIQFYSCFISYNSHNDDFARRLHGRMQQEKLRVWYAPEDMKGGDYFYTQIDEAIRVYDKLLLVLSEESINSKWVMFELRKAFRGSGGQRKLFPIRLVDIEQLKQWECIDPDTGDDLALEVRRYHIPDFTQWKGHDAFEKSFARLLRDLKAAT